MGNDLCSDILNSHRRQKSLLFGIVHRKVLVCLGTRSEANGKLYC